jgi:hypothetical protein
MTSLMINRYPDIVDVPGSFLVRSCTDDVRVAVEDLKRGNNDAISIDSVPALRKAYHYIRAWAVARGLFRNGYVHISYVNFFQTRQFDLLGLDR